MSGPQFFEKRMKSLTELDEWQGKAIESVKQAQALYHGQIGFAERAVQRAIVKHLKRRSTGEAAITWMSYFWDYMKDINAQKFIKFPKDFFDQQTALYTSLHCSTMEDVDKLSMEFILGLARFQLAIQVLAPFVKDLIPEKQRVDELKVALLAFDELNQYPKLDFFKRLDQIAKLAEIMIAALVAYLERNKLDYWQEVDKYFACHKKLKQLAYHLVSMQYVPGDLHFVGMAQTVHWNGFGGDANILKQFKELGSICEHALFYHGGLLNQSYFLQRLNFSREIRAKLTEEAGQKAAAAIKLQFPEQKTLLLYDLCSGPKHAACQPVIDQLPDHDVRLVVSDVDGNSLAQAFERKQQYKKEKSRVQIEGIYYEDLNFPLGDHHTAEIDVAVAGIGLHQLPKERIPKLLNELARKVKPGGFILNPDASEFAPHQIFYIPANLVDREGHVPDYTKIELKSLIQDIGDGKVRVTYPLHQLCSLPSTDLGLFMFNMFIVVDMNHGHVADLLEVWEQKGMTECDAIIYQCAGIDVAKLQKEVLEQVEASKAHTYSPK